MPPIPPPAPFATLRDCKRVLVKPIPAQSMKNLLTIQPLPEQILADFNWKPAPKIKRKRPFTVAIRLSLIEKQLIEERRGSLSVADFMRAAAIGQNVTQREMVRQVVPPRVDAELKRQVAYLGNNLNQLTKLAHEHHQIGNLNVVSLALELAYIRYQLDYLVNHFTAPKRDHEGFVVDGIDEEFAQ